MSMALYSPSEIRHSAWIEMRSDVTMRYELDHDNEMATLYFGHRDDYVIMLGRENLGQFLELGRAAAEELDKHST
jgi:hypothetical protein